MSQLTKNEAARLRKVAAHLDTCLDALHRAAGEMYIPPLKLYRDDVQELIAATQETLDEVRRVLPPRRTQAEVQSSALAGYAAQVDQEDKA